MKTNASRRRRTVVVLLSVILALVIIRLFLPYIVRSVANKKLASLDGYHGHVGDVRLSLWRGAYGIDDFIFSKKDSITQDTTPFMRASAINFSLEWKSLLKGSVVAEVEALKPELRFTREKVEPQTVVRDSAYLKKLADLAMPLAINRLSIADGTLRYIDESLGVDVQADKINAVALNLKNGYDSTSAFPAGLQASAMVYQGRFEVNAKVNPLKIDPTFRMNARLEGVELPQLNDFFNAYAHIDVNQGRFGLFAEAEAESGKFDGYVKPVIKGLDVLSLKDQDRNDNFFRKAWEAIVGVVTEIFENQPKEQVATKIRLHGSLENPSSNWLLAIGYILRNAFIQALQPSIDHEINLQAGPAGQPSTGSNSTNAVAMREPAD
ncbi:MAG: hypothetical protein ABS46_20140 [Cytophagaceae bacterium SCN 52-12]|nr:MAG: hypothetical protein ABS46_20140 [Cytophagaceae bacterium SCN 52-12]